MISSQERFLSTRAGIELTTSGLIHASSNSGTKLREDKIKRLDLI